MSAAVRLIADGGAGRGLGHLTRSSALAVALECRGLRVSCFAHDAPSTAVFDGVIWRPLVSPNTESEVEPGTVIIVDSYRYDPTVVPEMPTIRLHDYGPRPVATLVVAPAEADNGLEPGVLRGLRYAPLRPAYWGVPRRASAERVRRILVTTGGSDPGGSGSRLAAVAQRAAPNAEITLVRGPQAIAAPPSGVRVVQSPATLLDEFLRTDLVVSATGQTILEALATGAPCIGMPLVDNQRGYASALESAEAAAVVWNAERDLASTVRRLTADRRERRRLSLQASSAVDGFGALRVAFEIERLARSRAHPVQSVLARTPASPTLR